MTKENKSVVVDADCWSCGGTGIYRGFAEPKSVGVVCLTCEGTGKMILTYTPFTARKLRNDVETVQRSTGSFVATGVGPTGSS